MGANALIAEVVGTCGSLVAGAAVGSTCTLARDRCSGRVCHCQGGPQTCGGGPLQGCTMDEGALLTVECVVHDAEIPRGVLGVVTDNEPVVGVRTRALPFVQAIGRPNPGGVAGSFASRHCREGEPAREVAITGPEKHIFGEGLQFDRYSFADMRVPMQEIGMNDDVVIGFGVRTVVRVPLLGITNAPLDFDVLGSVMVPLRKLIHAPQPVEICVPIVPKGDTLRQVVSVTLSINAVDPSFCYSVHAIDDLPRRVLHPLDLAPAVRHRVLLDKDPSLTPGGTASSLTHRSQRCIRDVDLDSEAGAA